MSHFLRLHLHQPNFPACRIFPQMPRGRVSSQAVTYIRVGWLPQPQGAPFSAVSASPLLSSNSDCCFSCEVSRTPPVFQEITQALPKKKKSVGIIQKGINYFILVVTEKCSTCATETKKPQARVCTPIYLPACYKYTLLEHRKYIFFTTVYTSRRYEYIWSLLHNFGYQVFLYS